MKKIITALALAAGAASSQACITGPWVSSNKTLHAVGNAGIVFIGDGLVKSFAPATFEKYPYLGLIPAVAASAYREHWKASHGFSCEWASITYDAIGMGAGVLGTHFVLVPQQGGAAVVLFKEF